MIEIYTDGSCNTRYKIGVWGSLILGIDERKIITGSEMETTHQRMELRAVLESLQFLEAQGLLHNQFVIFSDSQYVIGLENRKKKLTDSNYISGSGSEIQNTDLLKLFYQYLDRIHIPFTKVMAHKSGNPFNREIDMICRKEMREFVNRMKANG